MLRTTLVRRSAITPPVSLTLENTGCVAPPRHTFGYDSSSRLAIALDCSASLLRKLGAYFRSVSLVVATLALATLFTGSGIATAQDKQKSVEDLVAAVESFYAAQDNFSATFEQRVARQHLPDRPITKSGRVYFKKPGKMRWDYEEPDKVYYISDGKVLWNYVPESKLAYRLDVKDSELFYALKFLWGEGSLAKDFNVSDGGKDGSRRVLVIKPQSAEHNFQQLRFFVAAEAPNIEETELTDPAGNVSRLVFKKVSHQELPEKGFQFEPPADVQVEDLSAPVAPTE